MQIQTTYEVIPDNQRDERGRVVEAWRLTGPGVDRLAFGVDGRRRLEAELARRTAPYQYPHEGD